MRANAWLTSSLTASALLLSACATGSSSVVTPELEDYSKAFQAKAADELAADDRRPCDRREPHPPCSALKRLAIDYGNMREKVRAARDGGAW